MTHPQHHLHIRKRIHQKKQKYPHPNPWVAFLDKTIIVMGVLNTFATLPQVLEIWIGKDAGGISIFSWAYYSFFATLLLVYGIVHKEKPIIVTYTGGVVMYTLVLVGAVLYK